MTPLTLKDKGDPTLTRASLAALLPAEHLVTREAFAPKTVNQGATAITWPRLVDAIKAFFICQQPINLIQTGLPEELEDPEEPEPERASENQPKSEEPEPEGLEEPGDHTTKDGVIELEPEKLETPGDPEPEPEAKSGINLPAEGGRVCENLP